MYIAVCVFLMIFYSFITGEVIFNQAQPDFPPDFIFGLQDQDFIPNIDEVKVLLSRYKMFVYTHLYFVFLRDW